MKDLLNSFYNINILQYKEYNNGIIFQIDGINFYLVECEYTEEYLHYLESLIVRYSNLKLHSFVYNKYNKILSSGFILLKLNIMIEDISLYDLNKLKNIRIDKINNNYLTMDQFWENKIDYLEKQLAEISSNKLINNSFDYFLGIAEILISYFKRNFNKNNLILSVSHRSLYSLSTIDFYNPLNICFDYYLKDYIAYIRLTNNYDLLYELISNIKNKNDYTYLFVRMTFPFKYFYEVENILIDGVHEHDLVKIVNEIKDYEMYLAKIEKVFRIYVFSWIKKE